MNTTEPRKVLSEESSAAGTRWSESGVLQEAIEAAFENAPTSISILSIEDNLVVWANAESRRWLGVSLVDAPLDLTRHMNDGERVIANARFGEFQCTHETYSVVRTMKVAEREFRVRNSFWVIQERDRSPRFAVAETTEFAPFRGGGSLQQWIESWPQPVVLIGGDDKVKFSNSALRRLLGYQERTPHPDDLSGFVADATIEVHLAGFRAEPSGARHVRVRDHAGRDRVLLTCRVPVPAVLAPDEMMIIAHDVTGRVSDVDVAEPILLPKSLSPREREVVELMLTGHRVKNIAEMLFLSEHTVRNHLRSVFAKTGVGSQSELIRMLRA